MTRWEFVIVGRSASIIMCDLPPSNVSPDQKWDLKSPTIFGAHKQPYTHTHTHSEHVCFACVWPHTHTWMHKIQHLVQPVDLNTGKTGLVMAGPFAHNLLTPAYCKWMRDGLRGSSPERGRHLHKAYKMANSSPLRKKKKEWKPHIRGRVHPFLVHPPVECTGSSR